MTVEESLKIKDELLKEKKNIEKWIIDEKLSRAEFRKYIEAGALDRLFEHNSFNEMALSGDWDFTATEKHCMTRCAIEVKYRPKDNHTRYNSVLLEKKKRYRMKNATDMPLYYATLFKDGVGFIHDIRYVNSTWQEGDILMQYDNSGNSMKVVKPVYFIPNNEGTKISYNDENK